MLFEFRRPDIEQALAKAQGLESLNQAIVQVMQLTFSLSAPEIIGRQLYAPGLDAAIPEIAAKLGLRDVAVPKGNGNVCIIASQLAAFGGHSRVAAEISELIGAEHTTLIMTDMFAVQRHAHMLHAHPAAAAMFQRRAVVLLGARTPGEKVIELYNILAAIRPSRIFLLANHMDVVAYAAAWPFRGVVDFLHHADHQPTLGPTLPFSAHVDLTYTCHKTCCRAGLTSIYAGVSVGHCAPLPPPHCDARPRLVATSGTEVKFRGPSAYRWLDYAAAALADPAVSIVHVGPVSEDFRTELLSGLAGRGVAPSRYEFAGWTANVAAELHRRNVDAYVSSYPVPGGKVNVEVMAVGLPPIVAIDAAFPDHMRYDFPAPAWIPIGHPSELSDALDRSLALRAQMAGAEGRAVMARELRRFSDYVGQGGG